MSIFLSITEAEAEELLLGTVPSRVRLLILAGGSPGKHGPVLKAVADVFGMREKDLRGKKQYTRLSQARAVAAYIMKDHLGMSYPEIGDVMNKHHTTVMSARKKILRDMNLRGVGDAIAKEKGWSK